MTPANQDQLQSHIEWLNRVRLFADIREMPEAIAALAGIMERKTYADGLNILEEGCEGADAFFLMQGRVKVLKSTTGGDLFPVAELDASDHPFFGEAALLQTDRRMATIRAETTCHCLVLHKQRFDAFCHAHPQWALPITLRIARVVLERLHKANNDVVLLYNALVGEVKGWNAA